MDPRHTQPAPEMPCHEFDGVDYTRNQPGNAPPPAVHAYFDSGLHPALLTDRLDDLVAGMTATLAAVTGEPSSPRGQWMRRGQLKSHGAPWTPQTRDTVAADLRADRLDVFHLVLTGDRAPQRQWILDAWTHPQPADTSDAAVTMSLYGTDMWPADATDTAADEVLALLRGWVQPLALRTAAVTHDRGGSNISPWEKWYGTSRHVTATLTRERVRGYYWANLLTAGHLARLGGLDRLRAHAAEHGMLVEPADPQHPHDAVILRAPGPITAFDDDRLAAAKHVLTPALMHLRYAMYLGHPMRIIPDPGTAFRRVPPGSPFPRLLDGLGPYADEVR